MVISSAAVEPHHHVLYWNWVFGITWQWLFVSAIALSFYLAFFIAVWAPWRALPQGPWLRNWLYPSSTSQMQPVSPEKALSTPRPVLQSVAISGWSSVILSATSVWIDTVYHQYRAGWTLVILFFGFVIVLLTFALEGLETAYTELRDKDKQQFSDRRAADIIDGIDRIGEDSFFEAREWTIIALLVGATYLIEQKAYFFPWIGNVGADSPESVSLVRALLTVILTTFALAWFAQSPGKYVARQNSVEFLNYMGPAPLWIIRGIWGALSFFGLHHPSEAIDSIMLKTMAKCQNERNLLPSELTFFADSLKKYGYGYLITDDVLDINVSGACNITSRNLSYVGINRSGVRKTFQFEEGYIKGTASGLRNTRPDELKCWAFEVPTIGERVTEELLDDWARLFYADDPELWIAKEYSATEQRRVCTEGFRIQVLDSERVIVKSKERDTHKLDVELIFNHEYPKQSQRGAPQKAVLILWEVAVTTQNNTFDLPHAWGDKTRYPYFKKRTYPCLRATVTFTLPPGVIFADINKPENYQVVYDSIRHKAESERFLEQYRPKMFGAPERPVTQDMFRKLVIYNDSALPAASYDVTLYMVRETPEAEIDRAQPIEC